MCRESPEELEQYHKLYEERLATVEALLDDPEWKEDKKEENITFYTRYDPSSSFAQIKSVVPIPLPIEKVSDFLKVVKVVDDKTPKDQREGCIQRRIQAEIPAEQAEGGAFYYIQLESPSFVVSSRDFLMYRRVTIKGNRHILLQVSVVNDKIMPPVNKVVRGNMFFQGLIAEKVDDNNTKLTFICHADPAGSIPATVYNMAAMKQGYAALRVRNGALAANQ